MDYVAFCISTTGHRYKVYSDGQDISVESKHGKSFKSISGYTLKQAISNALERHTQIYQCSPVQDIIYQ